MAKSKTKSAKKVEDSSPASINIDDVLLKSSQTLQELKKKKQELYSNSWSSVSSW
jgi:hypothetical protein